MKSFWFYCTNDELIDDPQQYIPFNVEPSNESLARHSKNVLNDPQQRSFIVELYKKTRMEMIDIIKQLKIQMFEDDVFIMAKDVPIIRKKLLEQGWKESR